MFLPGSWSLNGVSGIYVKPCGRRWEMCWTVCHQTASFICEGFLIPFQVFPLHDREAKNYSIQIPFPVRSGFRFANEICPHKTWNAKESTLFSRSGLVLVSQQTTGRRLQRIAAVSLVATCSGFRGLWTYRFPSLQPQLPYHSPNSW